MKKYLFFLSLFFALAVEVLNAQAMDEMMVQYSRSFEFKEGIYLNFEEFKNNNPSIVENIKRDGNSIMLYNDSANEFLPINPYIVWGYSLENNIYIAAEDNFWKLINIGQLSQFTAIVITRIQTLDAYGFPVERYSKVLSHLFLDFNSGEVKRLNKKNLAEYLDETTILTSKVKKRLKSESGLIVALKAYNELYPIYFPIP